MILSPSRSVGIAMLIAASVLWSLSGLAVKLAKIDPVAFAFYRCFAAAVPMALIAGFSRGRRPPWKWAGFSAIVYTAVVTFLIAAMTWGTAASGILLQYTSPIFCALLAWVFQRRAIERQTIIALVIASVGISIMIGWLPANQSLAGPALGLLSGVAFGALILILEKIDRLVGGEANPFMIVLLNNAGAALILLPICLHQKVLHVQPWQLGIVAATGVIQLGFPYVLFQLGLRRVHPVDASLLILLEPVLNPIWVAMFVGERPDLGTIIGGIAILAALVIEATKGNGKSESAPSGD